jgi:methyl-accepting chemotaxis protein
VVSGRGEIEIQEEIKMIRRMLGIAMLLVGVSGIGASVVGLRLGHAAVEAIGADLESSLLLLSESLDTVGDSLLLAKSTVGDVNQGVKELEGTLNDLVLTIDETQPLLEELGGIASEDIPDSVEAMQESFPGMSQVAGVIDDTLTTLNRFRIDEEILGFRINYDLGINYDPSMPFDETVDQIGQSLDGLPARLRGLRVQVDTTSDNLELISQDMETLAISLAEINGRMEGIDPLIDEYNSIVTDVNDRARRIRRDLADQVDDARRVVTFLMLWLGLSQFAPLYLGWELAMSRRPE